MKRLLCTAIIALTFGAPLIASASPGFITASLNLRSGPDTDYPPVDVLPAGIGVDIQGCIDGYTWCDVIVDGNRGWVAGQYVQYEYENRRVYVHDYGARIGIPIVAFALGAYWDSYYRQRPWYHDRERWIGSSHGHRPVFVGPGPGYHNGPGYHSDPGYHPGNPGYHPQVHESHPVVINHPSGYGHNGPGGNPQEHHDAHPTPHHDDSHHDEHGHDDHGHEHEH